MTTNRDGTIALDPSETTRLFAAALDGDRAAGATLNLLGGYDEIAHRASMALVDTDHDLDELMPPHVLASIDRTLAALRHHSGAT